MARPQALHLYLSTAIMGDIAAELGAPHYSYHFAAQRFASLLTHLDQPVTRLAMPEYYATRAALPAAPVAPCVHLIFRSTEQIRLLKPAINICCFAWEFPVLKTDTLPGEHPFANQVAMLSLCDEIWTPSGYAATVLRAHGLVAVHRIPAPIPLPARGRRDRRQAHAALGGLEAMTLDINFTWPHAHQTAQTRRTATSLNRWIAAHKIGRHLPVIFLSVLNPEDFRKNLDAMLRGFHQFRRAHPNAVLIVKALTAAARFALCEVAGDVIRNKLDSGSVLRDDGIAVINAYLSDTEMSMLYSLADFYLCTSLAEGQNLPLLEAMGHGTLPVTTCNTAMADYVTDDNACVIAAPMQTNTQIHLAGTIAQRSFAVSLCTAAEVAAALAAAIALTAPQRTARAQAAIATVGDRFSETTVAALVEARFAHHARNAPP